MKLDAERRGRSETMDRKPILALPRRHKPDNTTAVSLEGRGCVRRRLAGGDNSNNSYVRIRPSSKTGGYVGSADSHNFAYCDDDSTVGAGNTVRSSPELWRARRTSHSTGDEKTLFKRTRSGEGTTRQQQAQLSSIPATKQGSFLKRWKWISNAKQNSVSVDANSSSLVQSSQTANSSSATAAARQSSLVTVTDMSNRSVVARHPWHPGGGPHSVTTPIRSNAAAAAGAAHARFILPDETPPLHGAQSSSPQQKRQSGRQRPSSSSSTTTTTTVDHTSSGAVVHHQVQQQQRRHKEKRSEEHDAFEMTISSSFLQRAVATAPTPPTTTGVRRRSNPVDLDETYDEQEDEDQEEQTMLSTLVTKLGLANDQLLDETCCSPLPQAEEDALVQRPIATHDLLLRLPQSETDEAISIVANPTLSPAKSNCESTNLTQRRTGLFRTMGSLLHIKGKADADEGNSVDDDHDDAHDDGVTEFSLAPLHAAQHVDITTTASMVPSKATKSKSHRAKHGKGYKWWTFPRIRRDRSSVTAVALLERERLAAKEAETKKRFLEQQELTRIEQKRRDYLENERARERDQPRNLSPEQRESIFVSMELVEHDSKIQSSHDSRKKDGTTFTQSTAPTTSTSKTSGVTLPACVVCREENRTHIATPCMHFSYCERCARRLSLSGRICYVCSRSDVTFSKVSV
jgi:Zinc finger, C3HC4 type (RING finger)